MKWLRKIVSSIVISLVIILLIILPVFAISNPTSISFGVGVPSLYKVFENVLETGDMLFIAEGYVYYAVAPTDYTASQAFLFQVLNASGNTTLLSTPLQAYGDRPISIYQTAAQKTAAGLVSGTAYGFRIMGNPLIFASPTGNSITAYLTTTDWIDQSTATEVLNPLKEFCLDVADNMETVDTATYIITVQGIEYINTTCGSLFLTGVPSLDAMCKSLFQASLTPLGAEAPATAGTYAATLTPLAKWGATVANGLTNLGVWIGLDQGMAGSVVLMALGVAFAFYVFRRTESGLAVILLVVALPFTGSYFGLMPLALAFVIAFFLAVVMSYFFFSRGTL